MAALHQLPTTLTLKLSCKLRKIKLRPLFKSLALSKIKCNYIAEKLQTPIRNVIQYKL